MSFKSVLITGATGFIGSRLATALLKSGVDVGLIVRQTSELSQLGDVQQYKLYHYDGTVDSLKDAIEQQQPEVVFHLASLFLTSHQPEDIEPLINSNILFPTQLLEAMALCGVSKLINTGTSWQHYNSDHYEPACLYAATKQAFESLMQYYVSIGKISAITLKLFDTYGDNDPRKKLISLLLSLAESKQLLAMSPGEQLIDIVHIDDVIQAFLIAAARINEQAEQPLNESYGISSGKPLTLRELVKTFESVIGDALNIEWGAREYRDREVMQPWSSYRQLPGWQPQITFAEGFRRLVSGITSNLKL